jgi:hypothetical protein
MHIRKVNNATVAASAADVTDIETMTYLRGLLSIVASIQGTEVRSYTRRTRMRTRTGGCTNMATMTIHEYKEY